MCHALNFLGLGVTSTATIADIDKLLWHVSEYRLNAIATLAGKEFHPVLRYVGELYALPVLAFPASQIEALTPRLKNPSSKVYQLVRCHGVAEGAALAAGGENAVLAIEKINHGGVTLAMARVINL